MGTKPKYEKSSGNVYADLGIANSEEHLAKARLAMRIEEVLRNRKLTQKQAAQLLGISQPKISAIMNGQLKGFSMERLILLLNKLNQDVKITVSTKRGRPSCGGLEVAFA